MPRQEDDPPAAPGSGDRLATTVPAQPQPDGSADVSRLPLPPSPELDAAVAALQRGEALDVHEELLFKSLYRPLHTLFANCDQLSSADVADLTQFTLTRVFDHIDEYRSAGTLWSWVKRIAMNTLSNHLRDQEALKRRASLEVPLEPAPPRDDEPPPRPDKALSEDPEAETRLLDREKRRLLRDALDELPEGMRKAMTLRLSGLQYNEIADTLGVGLNTVRSQLHAAKDRLRRILEAYFPELEGGEER
jgi:RNA polymerase sigma-70 factor (ECF subfamily)